jgi:hypothetical protein
MGFPDWLYKPAGKVLEDAVEESGSTKDQRANLTQSGNLASDFATEGQDNYRGLGAESYDMREALRRRAAGQDSMSAEQLRQGLQQNLAGQRSMAASASPQNAAMAARTGAIQMGRLGAGMSGQAAMAGIAERQAAEKQLADMLMQQRQQELQAALQSRQNAISGYQGIKPEGSWLEKYQPVINAGTSAAGYAASDERLKTDIKDGDSKAAKVLEGLKAFSYKYKSDKHGKGDQFGPMAQDMEKAGLGHAVIDTPEGKMVHGAKAALSGLALTASLAKRVAKLEGKK